MFDVVWFKARNATWHKVLAWMRYAEEPWTPLTACGASMPDAFGDEGIREPPKAARCRKCEIAEIVQDLGTSSPDESELRRSVTR